MPKVGERHDNPDSAWILEWDGQAWAAVCPVDDVPMTTRDGKGRLYCGVCDKPAVDLVRKR